MALCAAMFWYASQPLNFRQSPVDFEISRGESVRKIAASVIAAGVDVQPLALIFFARVSGYERRIKAGSYRIEHPLTPWALIQLISSGANAYSDISFIEGWSFGRIRTAMANHPDLMHETTVLSDKELAQRLGLEASPEGLFAPDSYSFSRGDSDFDLLRRAHLQMKKVLHDEWNSRSGGLPLATPYEALILASIVEKETGRDQDRAQIASVFINRLRIGMPLQSDPTVIYGLGAKFDGNLRKRDLLADTPFNSYTRKGLPPTPIAMPGKAALHATLHPAKSEFLYFVARGDGSSAFSRSLDEHNRAVARYQKAGR